MTMRGRCNNLGLCDNATRQRTIEVPEADPFVCPKCETALISVADLKSTRSAASMALPMVVISIALAGAGYKTWDIYGRPATPSVTPATAQAVPQPIAAMTSQAASVFTPAPAAEPAASSPAVRQITPPAPAPAQTDTATAPPARQQLAAAAIVSDMAMPPAPQVSTAAPAPAAMPAPAAISAPAAIPVTAPVQAAAAPAASKGLVQIQETAAMPLTVAVTPVIALAADPSQRVHAFLGNATRVPVTFTFRSSVVALTPHSEHDVDRLVGYLKQHHATGSRLYLAGFTDNQGNAASNDAVSQKRVAAVAAALAEAGMTPAHVASFGADMPVADNATQSGRDRNRRVEVYLSP